MIQALGYLMIIVALVGCCLYGNRRLGISFRRMLLTGAVVAAGALYLTIAALLIAWPSPGG